MGARGTTSKVDPPEWKPVKAEGTLAIKEEISGKGITEQTVLNTKEVYSK